MCSCSFLMLKSAVRWAVLSYMHVFPHFSPPSISRQIQCFTIRWTPWRVLTNTSEKDGLTVLCTLIRSQFCALLVHSQEDWGGNGTERAEGKREGQRDEDRKGEERLGRKEMNWQWTSFYFYSLEDTHIARGTSSAVCHALAPIFFSLQRDSCQGQVWR